MGKARQAVPCVDEHGGLGNNAILVVLIDANADILLVREIVERMVAESQTGSCGAA